MWESYLRTSFGLRPRCVLGGGVKGSEGLRVKSLEEKVLGSSRLLLQKGLIESLEGRFELLTADHWSYREMREAFGFSVEDYILYGGYPGSVAMKSDETRFRAYVRESKEVEESPICRQTS